jgi:hypothetical protein
MDIVVARFAASSIGRLRRELAMPTARFVPSRNDVCGVSGVS